jgi:cholesterol oxidase
MSQPQWKLPNEAMRHGQQGWQVKSEAGWGAAQAVFAPLRKGAHVWELVAPSGGDLQLIAVDDETWTPVPMAREDGATHYLCMLRYDQPAQRPGRSFFHMRKQVAPVALPPQVSSTEGDTSVSTEELRCEIERLQDSLAERFARFLVNAAPVDLARRAPASPDTLSFAFASCQYPAGMLDRPVAHASYRALARYLDRQEASWPERLLLLGDQVYTDATSGMLDPVRLDDRFRIPYEEMSDRENGPWSELPQEFLARVRMTPDDHEIRDNWEPFRPGGTGRRFRVGMEAYWRHQRPGETRGPDLQIIEEGPGWRLFMADSRTQRPHRSTATLHQALILGEAQTGQLEKWLRQGEPGQLKIVTTAAQLLPRSRLYIDDPIYLDSWQGYPASFQRLLAFLCDHQVRNTVFLSGDTHLGCRAEVTVRNVGTGDSVDFQSCHAPALYAPYPFANETRWNLLLQDSFRFEVGTGDAARTYECTVKARTLEDGRGGCAVLQAQRRDGDWQCSVEVLR